MLLILSTTMASTPSSSSLSAVLRCRGNFWTRNPPTKRPATSAYRVGPAGGGALDSAAERAQSHEASAWEAFLQGGSVFAGGKLTVEYKLPGVYVKALKEKVSEENNKLCHSKLWQSKEDARSAVPVLRHAPARQLAHRLTSTLPGIDKISWMIKDKIHATRVLKIKFVNDMRDFQADVFKASTCMMGNVGQIPSLMLTSWSTVKSACLCLTSLVSEFMFGKLAVLCRSVRQDAPLHLLNRQDVKTPTNDTLQANEQINNPTDLNPSQHNSGSGQKFTEDGAD